MAEKKKHGITFYDMRTGEESIVSRPAQIKAYVESSDMGVNRQSDVGIRLGAEWVKKIRKAKKNGAFMQEILKQYGKSFKDVDILIELYSREATAIALQQIEESDDFAFEDAYLSSIKNSK